MLTAKVDAIVHAHIAGIPGDRKGRPYISGTDCPAKSLTTSPWYSSIKRGHLFPVHHDRGITLPVIRSFFFNLQPTLVCFTIDKIGNYEISSDWFPIQAHQRKALDPGIQRSISSIPEAASSSSSRAFDPDRNCHKRTERYKLITGNSLYIAHLHYRHIKTFRWGCIEYHYRLDSALCIDLRAYATGLSTSPLCRLRRQREVEGARTPRTPAQG